MKAIYYIIIQSTILTGALIISFEVLEQANLPLDLFLLFLLIASGPIFYPFIGTGSEIYFLLIIIAIIFLLKKKLMKNNFLLFISTFIWCFLGFMIPIAGSM